MDTIESFNQYAGFVNGWHDAVHDLREGDGHVRRDAMLGMATRVKGKDREFFASNLAFYLAAYDTVVRGYQREAEVRDINGKHVFTWPERWAL